MRKTTGGGGLFRAAGAAAASCQRLERLQSLAPRPCVARPPASASQRTARQRFSRATTSGRGVPRETPRSEGRDRRRWLRGGPTRLRAVYASLEVPPP